MNIKHLNTFDQTLYAYEGGELRELPRDNISERLRLERQTDGTLVAEQTLDTPIGILDYGEVFCRTANDQLLKPVDFVPEKFVLLELLVSESERIRRSLTNDENPRMNDAYWTVDPFGVIRSSVDAWTGETFVRECGSGTYVCKNPSKLRVYDSEREAAFYNNAFGGQTMKDRFAFDSVAEGELRNAVHKLREVMERHDARIIYDQDTADLLFAKATPPDGWNVFSDCRGSEFEHNWFEIPASIYRDFGLGDCNYFHLDLPEYLVKKEA